MFCLLWALGSALHSSLSSAASSCSPTFSAGLYPCHLSPQDETLSEESRFSPARPGDIAARSGTKKQIGVVSVLPPPQGLLAMVLGGVPPPAAAHAHLSSLSAAAVHL
ncbi:hypothetical protein D4764_02G0010980 [Takifugu flavidus]|uniref:Secreted protein n=1 Tax=Takifugu flavidus TaxID=433684 RepID=A0A5C6NQX2_9TELE|nr:hypothetical protein D4764_02G0010980 [Takifugu flavidus]